MNDENKTLEEQLEDMTNTAKRALADLANFKRQAQEERSQLMALGKITVLTDMLPVLDNLNRAFKAVPAEIAEHEWTKGIQNIKQQLENLLSEAGLQKIPTEGKVDPNLHEVVTTAPGEPDTIIEVLENGYTFEGRVVRAAKVVAGS